MKTQDLRIAIIDDDPFVITHLTRHFGGRIPGATIIGVSNPVAPVGYDVYIVDREFGEDSCGQELVRRIKQVSPTSLVIAYSAFLDRDFLRDLVLQDCEGAFDKGSLEELEKMIKLIKGFLERNHSGTAAPVSSRNTVRSIIELVREWNIRISQNGHAAARYYSDV